MERTACLDLVVRRDSARLRLLRRVRALDLPDCWIAAGFLRNAVWDYLHRPAAALPYEDVDVIWFDDAAAPSQDARIEALLLEQEPLVRWSVKNQARMHGRNADPPYASAAHAMGHWVETTAAVAVRLRDDDGLEFSTPLGTDDLFGMVLRPGPRFRQEKHQVFLDRCRDKHWFERWPLLTLGS